jgi:LPXTG-motif cell wall-anchored protein
MTSKHEKSIIVFLCAIGISCMIYGMGKENNTVFMVGLLLVIAGYILIRRKLRECVQKGR